MTYVAPEKVFAHLDRLTAWQRGRKAPPVTVEWDLSNRCSLGCTSCHFAHTHVRGPWTLRAVAPDDYDQTGDLADVELVRRGLREMATAGVQGVVWSGGGEPTLHPQWAEIVAYAHRCGLEQGMYTLGGHLRRANDVALLACAAAWIVVSLDCADAETYAREKRTTPAQFGHACEAIRALASVGQAVVGVSYLLHARNWRQVEAMVALTRRLGATYTTFRPLIETAPDAPGRPCGDRAWFEVALPRRPDPALGDVATPLKRVAREPDVEIDLGRFAAYRDWAGHGYDACYGVRLHATVTPDGRVWACPQRRGMRGSCLGDLREESFGEVWTRHPGQWTVDGGCRAMCRLHQVNSVLATVFRTRAHEAFV